MTQSKKAVDLVEDSKKTFELLEKYRKIPRLHVSDNAKEFKRLEKLFAELPIDFQYTSGYDSNANSYAERSIRTLLEPARCILKERTVPWGMIDFDVQFVIFVKNHLIRKHKQEQMIPYTELKGRVTSLPKHLYNFGCKAYARRPGDEDRLLESRENLECVYIGPGSLCQQRGAVFIELNNLKDNEPIQPFVTRKYRIFEDQSAFANWNDDIDLDDIFDEDYQELNHGEEKDSEGKVQSEIENFDIDRELNQGIRRRC